MIKIQSIQDSQYMALYIYFQTDLFEKKINTYAYLPTHTHTHTHIRKERRVNKNNNEQLFFIEY